MTNNTEQLLSALKDAADRGFGINSVALCRRAISTLEASVAQLRDAWNEGYNARCDDEDNSPEKPTENPYETNHLRL